MSCMKNKVQKVGWIFTNSFSNDFKIKRLNQVGKKTKHKILVISSENLFLKNFSNGKVALIDATTNKIVNNPDFLISLIPDEKIDPVAYQIFEHLELNAVQFLNSVSSMRLATDKFKSNILLSKNGYKVPETMLISKHSNLKLKNFPYVIKPVDGRKSRGFQVINSSKELEKYQQSTTESNLIVQELITQNFRKDLRVYVMNGKIIGATKREVNQPPLPKFVTTSIEIDSNLEKKSLAIAKLFSLTFCCIDFFIDNQNTVCEVNANPGYKGFEKYTQKNLPEIIYKYF